MYCIHIASELAPVAKVGGLADVLLGLCRELSWKGIDVSAFLQFSYGNKVMNYGNSFLLNPGTDLRVNQTRAALRR